MNLIDAVINFFDPQAGLKRQQARLANETITESRKYNAATKGRRNGGWFRPKSTAAQEVSKDADMLAATGQDLGRNNPLGRRTKRSWGNHGVGKGIKLDLIGGNKNKMKKFMEKWDLWAESTDCDFEGHTSLYGLQWMWVNNVVESGAIFIRMHVNPKKDFPLQLQTFEQSQLDKSKTVMGESDKVIIDGVQYDENGQIEGYWFKVDKTNTGLGKPPESKFYKQEDIIHIFEKERAGQHLGASWLAAVANTLNNYDTYQDAKLMQQQIAACFALLVEEAESKMGVGNTSGTTELPDAIEPSMIEYIKAGQNVHTITPPKADNSANFDVGIKRDSAVGVGLTYEMLSGDYSLVNFASGRMGKVDFFAELDHVQDHVMLPQLNRIFSWFLKLYIVENGRGNYGKPDWTFPPRAAVNPQEEFDVLMSKVRHGMKSPSKAAKELGEKLKDIMEQWKADKETFGDLPFDIDPSMFAATGNQLDSNDASSANKGKVTDDPKNDEQ